MIERNNHLGGRDYSEEMGQVIYELATKFKGRDIDHSALKGVPPSQYMKYYVKSAGVIVELATALARSAPGGEKIKSFLSWIKTLTGFNIIQTGGLIEELLLERSPSKQIQGAPENE